ncbi:PAS domain S-box protein [Candidatus Magnetaquicoccus inordinatus]|uniref:PAS domain S-box protein n=1 Tax=Candidatus Magnetaquicoccus inordinatus TaxID=2496818 RepID=UPI001D0E5F59|nr:PAS domain S-box protein [Candidatus Magnetaquicoccus inordinatus]
MSDEKRNREARLAKESGKLTLAGPFELLQGGTAIIGRLPVFFDEADPQTFWGFTMVLIRMPALLDIVRLSDLEADGYSYELWRIYPDNDNRHVFAQSKHALKVEPATSVIDVPNGRWMLSIAPWDGWISTTRITVEAVFILLLSIASGWLARRALFQQAQNKNNAQLFWAVMNASPVPLAINEGDSFRYLNPAFEAVFGYSLDKIPTLEQWWQCTYPDSSSRKKVVDEWRARIEQCKQTSTPVEPLEVSIRCSDNSLRSVLLSIEPLGVPFIGQHLVVMYDVTQLRELADQHAVLFTRSPDASVIVDPENGYIIECNNATEGLLGGPREKIIGKSVIDISPVQQPDGRLSAEAGKEIILSSFLQGYMRFEWVHCRLDGTPFWAEVTVGRCLYKGRQMLLGAWREISNRKHAEARLQELLAFNESILLQSPLAVGVYHANGSCVVANAAYAILVGSSREDLMARNLHQIKSFISTGLYEACQNSLADKQARRREIHVPSSFGKEIWVECQIVPVLLNSEPHLVLQFSDLTEIKLREIALRASESRFRILYESTPAMLHSIDADGRIIYVSDNWLKKMGYNRSEVIGRQSTEFLTDESRQRAIETVLPLFFRKGITNDIPYQFVTKNGEVLDILLSAIGERDPNGRIVQSFTVLQDITQRNRDQRRIEQLLAEQKAILDNELIGIITIKEQTILWANPAFEHFFGYQRDAVVGVPLKSHFTSAHAHQAFIQAATPVLQSGKVFRTQWEFCNREGTPMWMDVSGSLLKTETGESVWAFLDVTEQRRTTLQLEAAKNMAETATRVKSEFLANMSHEIRTPMNAILGMADMLWESDLHPEQRQFVKVFRSAGENLLGIINDVLDLSKIEAGQLILETRPFHLADEMNTVCEIMALRANSKGLQLQQYIHPAVPNHLEGDSIRLRQIFLNLLSNAIKFTEQGMILFEATCPPTEQAPEQTAVLLQFKIKDTGIGISEERLQSIFENFVQADSSITRRFGGTGLGLPIVKKLVEKMGGEVKVASQPGTGTEFILLLPFALGKKVQAVAQIDPTGTDDEKNLSALPHGSGTGATKTPWRILLVDDSEENRLLIAAYLKNAAYALQIAENGKSALEMMRLHSFDLVLMDVQMPVMDGYSATRTWREIEKQEHRPRLPIFALTAYALQEDIAQSLEAGFDQHIAKPIKKKTLLEMIARVLHSDSR